MNQVFSKIWPKWRYLILGGIIGGIWFLKSFEAGIYGAPDFIEYIARFPRVFVPYPSRLDEGAIGYVLFIWPWIGIIFTVLFSILFNFLCNLLKKYSYFIIIPVVFYALFLENVWDGIEDITRNPVLSGQIMVLLPFFVCSMIYLYQWIKNKGFKILQIAMLVLLFLLLLIAKGDIARITNAGDLCELTINREIKDVCYFDIAQSKKDFQLCEKISKEGTESPSRSYSRPSCLGELAPKLQDAFIMCKELKEVEKEKCLGQFIFTSSLEILEGKLSYTDNEVWFEMRKREGFVDHLSLNAESGVRGISLPILNKKALIKEGGGAYKELIENLAKQNREVKIRGKLSEIRDESGFVCEETKRGCLSPYEFRVEALNDASICKQINEESLKEECYEYFIFTAEDTFKGYIQKDPLEEGFLLVVDGRWEGEIKSKTGITLPYEIFQEALWIKKETVEYSRLKNLEYKRVRIGGKIMIVLDTSQTIFEKFEIGYRGPNLRLRGKEIIPFEIIEEI